MGILSGERHMDVPGSKSQLVQFNDQPKLVNFSMVYQFFFHNQGKFDLSNFSAKIKGILK